jgi:hypothetical protein
MKKIKKGTDGKKTISSLYENENLKKGMEKKKKRRRNGRRRKKRENKGIT